MNSSPKFKRTEGDVAAEAADSAAALDGSWSEFTGQDHSDIVGLEIDRIISEDPELAAAEKKAEEISWENYDKGMKAGEEAYQNVIKAASEDELEQIETLDAAEAARSAAFNKAFEGDHSWDDFMALLGEKYPDFIAQPDSEQTD